LKLSQQRHPQRQQYLKLPQQAKHQPPAKLPQQAKHQPPAKLPQQAKHQQPALHLKLQEHLKWKLSQQRHPQHQQHQQQVKLQLQAAAIPVTMGNLYQLLLFLKQVRLQQPVLHLKLQEHHKLKLSQQKHPQLQQ
jgi:hypothetical protein